MHANAFLSLLLQQFIKEFLKNVLWETEILRKIEIFPWKFTLKNLAYGS